MNKNVKVSVITVCYNAVNTIERTICSVINQSYHNIEYIVIDGNSTDGTQEIVKKYIKYIDCFVSEADGGLYDAMNKGIHKATGDIIGIINSDDWYAEESVENVVDYFKCNDVDLVYGKLVTIYQNGERRIGKKIPLNTIWYQMAMPHPTVFIKKNVYEKYGVFDTKYKLASDYDLLLRLYTNKLRIGYMDNIIAYFTLGGLSCIRKKEIAEETLLISMRYVNICANKEEMIPKIKEKYEWDVFRWIINEKKGILSMLLNTYFHNDIKNIIVFGAGIWGTAFYETLKNDGITALYFTDNDMRKWNKKIYSVKIIDPNKLRDMSGYILITIKEKESEIKNQLKKMDNNKLNYVSIQDLEKLFYKKRRGMIVRKKIIYIFNDTGFGGAGQSLLDMLVQIRNVVDVAVVIREDAIMVERKFRELNITYYKICFSTDYVKIGDANIQKRKLDQKQSYEAAMQLVSIIKKEKIDLIHINSSVSYFGAIAALIVGIPYIWHIRELMEEQFGCEFLNEELKKSLYVQADKLITISDYVQQRYYEKYNLHTTKIYNGLDIDRFKNQIENNKCFRNVFLVAGMITPEKGQWDAIRAVEILIQRGYCDVRMIIVGGGASNYIWALKKYISNMNLEKNIYILPFCDDLSDLRKQASYAVTCSQNEALGRVTIEAMLAGNVVIGARSGGTTEIIGEHEERGFLYRLGDSQNLADTMIRAMQCPQEVKNKIIRKAQIYAEENFNSIRYCEKLKKLYDDIIDSFVPKKMEGFLTDLKENYELDKYAGRGEEQENVISKKNDRMSKLILKWLEIRLNGYSLSEYFIRNNIWRIAIYGMGILGCRLYDELEKSEIVVKYMVDRNPRGMEKVFTFSILDKDELEIDAIVVTVVPGAQQIINEICKKGYKKVIGLEEILDAFTFMPYLNIRK